MPSLSQMKVKLYLIGKIEQTHYQALSKLYLSRLKHYIPCELIIQEGAKISNATAEQVRDKDSAHILARLKISDYKIVLEKSGSSFDSEEFARWLQQKTIHHRGDLSFIIGGPLGLSRTLIERADLCLSLSAMTLPHEMCAVVLLEQLYRAVSILRREKYHK